MTTLHDKKEHLLNQIPALCRTIQELTSSPITLEMVEIILSSWREMRAEELKNEGGKQ